MYHRARCCFRIYKTFRRSQPSCTQSIISVCHVGGNSLTKNNNQVNEIQLKHSSHQRLQNRTTGGPSGKAADPLLNAT